MIVYILNLIDLMCTLYVINIGVPELNPLMQNIPFMIFYKIIIIGLLLLYLNKTNLKIAKYGIQICTVIYGLLVMYHGVFMCKIL